MKAEDVFQAALERKTPAERAAYLDGACGADAALHAQVMGLLRSHEQAGSFLDQPLFDAPTTSPVRAIAEGPGSCIGPYKLMEQIGEGGMGLVFVAEQQRPVQRKVALKIIKPGMDSRDVIARFEAERQALALMEHPHIAKVLDAGTTESGLPYFVMELVRGIPITDYCDKNQLTPRERLELFVHVCQAVQHAHTKGIIHRDLKPSNILVASHDGTPVVKVIDFGVAKVLGQRLTDKTIYTRFAQMIGTPLYMSPEQAALTALEPDTRSDVYSLGVLLYELLTGTTPFDRERLREAAFDEIRRIIREEEPPTPSVRLSSLGGTLSAVSARCKTEPRALSALVRGDLDWIVMKALEKDRGRRYETASGFAADVRRFLKDEPVEARPPSALYRFGKMARRNRVALTTATLVCLTLLLGTAVSLWQAVRATEAGMEARHQELNALAAAVTAHQQLERAERNEQIARLNEQKAKTERDNADKARGELRRLLYNSNMNGAYRAWQETNLSRALELVEQTVPQPGETDLRGFEWHFLNRVVHPDVLTLEAFPQANVRYSLDGKRLIATNKAKLLAWDAVNGKELHRFEVPESDWQICNFVPPLDGTAIFILRAQGGKQPGQSSELQLVELATGKPRYHIDLGADPNPQVALSADGRQLLAKGALFDAATGTQRLSLAPGAGNFSPDGRWVQVGDTIFDTTTGKKRATLRGLAQDNRLAVFSPDGTRLVTGKGEIPKTGGAWPGEIKIWDAATGEELFVFKDTGVVNAIVFHPDGRRFVASLAALQGWSVKMWDVQTGKPAQQFPTGANHLAFSPDGRWLATAFNRQVELWDVTSGQHNSVDPGQAGHTHIWSIAFSPDGHRLAVGQRFWQPLWVYDVAALQIFGEVDPKWKEKGMPGFSLALSPDAKHIACNFGAEETGSVQMIDTLTGRQAWRTAIAAKDRVTDVAFHPDGERLAVAVNAYPNAGRVAILSAGTGRQLAEFKTGVGPGIAFSPDGRLLATSSSEGIVLWETAAWKQRVVFHVVGQGHWLTGALAFSPDGKKLLSSGDDGTPQNNQVGIVWDAATGKELLRFKESIGLGVRSLAFSPDGTKIATPYSVRDAATGAVLFELKPDFNYRVINVAFSPDGRRVATDGQVMLFDVASGQAVARLKHKAEAPAHMIAFTQDGQRLAAVNEDGTLQIWNANPP